MANFPVYNFNDSTLDYDQVEFTVKQMYSYLNNETTCCKGVSLTSQLCKVDSLMQAMYIDGSDDLDLYNEERWKADVKAAYLTLYNLV